MPSTAVPNSDISRVVGYAIQGGNFATTFPNLPQCIAVIGEMNHANQSTATTPVQITSALQAALLYGWGSPLYNSMRHYFPANGGGGANGIPVWAFPVAEQSSPVANAQTITVSGTPTANVTHTVMVGGRGQMETGSYAINIVTTDTATTISTKIINALNNVLGCPMLATAASPPSAVATLTAKWYGLTSQGLTVSVNTNGTPAGISYAIAQTTAGTGTPSIDATLAQFGNVWYTIVDNTFGLVASIITSLETFNGNPDAQTGRYAPTIMKPFIAVTGSVVDSSTTSADVTITNADTLNNTISVAPAPLSLGLPLDASADYICRLANCAQNTPNVDIQGSYSVDIPMPAAGSNPATSSYTVRNAIVQMGMSTALIKNGAYEAEDIVTTYHPAGQTPPQFMYFRDVMIDLNIKYQFFLFLSQAVVNKQIANDNDSVSAANVCKPKDIRSGLATLINSLVSQGLCVSAAFSIANTVVNISTTNPNRFEITWPYKRSGVVRVISTTVTAGFNFGAL